ncbi:DUF3347 domain-containing protein [Phaeocystidibacter luteus]|uniref:DUF3347 domain-containing protein n=1 Tax=Phaeocystidibacter luteus TaxID=911197 RepID=A0A6N6RML6_9FLAO|nr:DUF3347 domain-containing protein [Phaeocystidibacter luteus]KAB2814813.1 DUF3347 domain-containing protein [Phaeocystidibacter luteus]
MKLFLPLAFLAFFMASCNSKPESKDTQQETQATAEKEPVVDNHATSAAVTAYMELKNALVESDVEKSAQAATSLSSQIVELSESDSLLGVIRIASDSLSMTSNLDVQRSAFEVISDNFYIYLKKEGHGRPIYRQYCPMAFNNDGAYWLAEEEDILNPYFGDMMLKCGRVDEEL